jgi:hypothetical protein
MSSLADLRRWIAGQDEKLIATFVIDIDGVLRLADRRSEHVACAEGDPVLAAGEIAFSIVGGRVEIAWITNQSTGYCPEPTCWPAVAAALRRTEIDPPGGFSRAFEFRRCAHCDSITIVKDDVYRCELCRADLPEKWNLAKHTP